MLEEVASADDVAPLVAGRTFERVQRPLKRYPSLMDD